VVLKREQTASTSKSINEEQRALQIAVKNASSAPVSFKKMAYTTVTCLLSNGANPNVVDTDQETPIFYVVRAVVIIW
jgi:hypothetical protein